MMILNTTNTSDFFSNLLFFVSSHFSCTKNISFWLFFHFFDLKLMIKWLWLNDDDFDLWFWTRQTPWFIFFTIYSHTWTNSLYNRTSQLLFWISFRHKFETFLVIWFFLLSQNDSLIVTCKTNNQRDNWHHGDRYDY